MAGFERGRVFAGHRIVRRIGEGGMGVVYQAVDERLRRTVALKVITFDQADDPVFRHRFVREARLLAAFDHPNVLPVYHFDEAEGLPYLTMRLAAGGSLRGLLRRGPLLPGHALRLLSQLAAALDALHRGGVVHLDVKPENVLLDGPAGDDHVWLGDLGLARYVHTAADSGEVAGTADYMAPEQWRGGGHVGPWTDVYAFALVLREALTGRAPAVPGRRPPRLERDHDLWQVLERALARDPGERHPSAGVLLDDVRAVVSARGPLHTPDDAEAARGSSLAGEALLSGSGAGSRDPSTPGPRPASGPGARGPSGPVRRTAAERTADAPPGEDGSARSPRWRTPVAVIAVAVALAGALWALWPAGSGRPRSSARAPGASAASPGGASPGGASPGAAPSGGATAARPRARGVRGVRRYRVCARSLTVRRDPLPEERTRIVATLSRGDTFVVERARGQAWVYGRSSGSAVATGWALRQWLRPVCP